LKLAADTGQLEGIETLPSQLFELPTPVIVQLQTSAFLAAIPRSLTTLALAVWPRGTTSLLMSAAIVSSSTNQSWF